MINKKPLFRATLVISLLLFSTSKITAQTVRGVENREVIAKEQAEHYKKVSFGIELLDFGINKVSTKRNKELNYYNIGLVLRLGDYRSPVQLELGVKPGRISWENSNASDGYYDEDGDYYDKDGNHYPEYNDMFIAPFRKLHLPVYSKLKVNLFDGIGDSKVYIGGLLIYNALRKELYENKYSVGAGAGIAWKHWDWFVYYKQDTKHNSIVNDRYVGLSIRYFF